MLTQLEDQRIIEVKFHKVPRTLTKSRFKGRLLIDTACVISEKVGMAAGEIGKEEISKALAVHCPKERYNRYRGKQVSLDRALSLTDEFSDQEKEVIRSEFEKEFEISKFKAGLTNIPA